MPNLAPLSPIRLTAITQGLNSPLLAPQELKFLNRTPVVQARDDEILGQWADRVQIADIIQDDAEAVTYSSGRMKFASYKIPSIKHGTSLNEAQIRELRNVVSNGGPQGTLFAGMQKRILKNLLLGVKQRMEAIIIGSYVGEFHYNRMGMRINLTFAIPADLKMVAPIPWTSITAKPITDIFNLRQQGRDSYGIELDRITLSTAALNLIFATTEFQDKAKLYIPPQVTFTNINAADRSYMTSLLSRMLDGIIIELYDARYFTQDDAGARTNLRFWPANRVAMTCTAFDNQEDVVDFASGEVMEAIVASMINTTAKGLPAGTFGPASYITGNEDLNPPNLDYWTVFRGFVRRKLDECSAVIDIGNVQDTITVVDRYP